MTMGLLSVTINGNIEQRLAAYQRTAERDVWVKQNNRLREKIRRTYGLTTKYFSHDARPRISVRTYRGGLLVTASMPDDAWNWVDQGRSNFLEVYPRNAQVMRFQSGYRPKSRPNTLRTTAGGPTGPVVFRRKVVQPPRKARNWTPLVQEEVFNYLVRTSIVDLRTL